MGDSRTTHWRRLARDRSKCKRVREWAVPAFQSFFLFLSRLSVLGFRPVAQHTSTRGEQCGAKLPLQFQQWLALSAPDRPRDEIGPQNGSVLSEGSGKIPPFRPPALQGQRRQNTRFRP